MSDARQCWSFTLQLFLVAQVFVQFRRLMALSHPGVTTLNISMLTSYVFAASDGDDKYRVNPNSWKRVEVQDF